MKFHFRINSLENKFSITWVRVFRITWFNLTSSDAPFKSIEMAPIIRNSPFFLQTYLDEIAYEKRDIFLILKSTNTYFTLKLWIKFIARRNIGNRSNGKKQMKEFFLLIIYFANKIRNDLLTLYQITDCVQFIVSVLHFRKLKRKKWWNKIQGLTMSPFPMPSSPPTSHVILCIYIDATEICFSICIAENKNGNNEFLDF